MRDSLQSQCSNFILNRDILKENFRMENCSLIHACTHIFLSKNIIADLDKLKACAKILGNGTIGIPCFRGNLKLPLISMLAVSIDLEEKFKCTMEIYKKFISESFQTESAAIAAMILADTISVDAADQYICRGKEIYTSIKKKYPFLTAEKDSVFAILMAFLDKSNDELIAEVMNIYTIMKNSFSYSNSVRSLSCVLSFGGGTVDEKCNKVNYLYSTIKEKGRNYGMRNELPVLGAAAMLSVDSGAIINDIIEVDDYLSAQKSLGDWDINNYTRRLMNAAMLVINDYSDKTNCSSSTIRICNNRIYRQSLDNNNISYAVIAAITSALALLDEQQANDNSAKRYGEACEKEEEERKERMRKLRSMF